MGATLMEAAQAIARLSGAVGALRVAIVRRLLERLTGPRYGLARRLAGRPRIAPQLIFLANLVKFPGWPGARRLDGEQSPCAVSPAIRLAL